MNLIQQANFLENVPKDQLAQMSQDPNGQFPPFLVLTEIQRRTMNEQNYKAMQEQPTTTVAEEVVGEFMQPRLAQNQSQGLQGGTPQSATPLPDSNISAGLSGVPTAPMQMAASGGLTGYAAGDLTSLPAGSGPQGQDITDSDVNTFMSLPRNADGTVDKSAVAGAVASGALTAAAVVGFFYPEPVSSAAGAARLATTSFGNKILSAPGKLKSGLQNFMGRRSLAADPMSKFGASNVTLKSGETLPKLLNTKQIGSQAIKDLRIPSRLGYGLTALTAGTGLGYALSDDETIEKQEDKKEMRIGDTYDKVVAAGLSADKNSSKGLGQGQMDYRDMIRLGTSIMGAKDISELGESVSGVLDAQDARATTGLQQQYLQAQTDKLQADIAAMPVKEIQSEISIYTKYLDQLRENSEGTESDIRDIKNASDYINALSQELMTARGIDLASVNSQKKLLEASGIGKV